MIHYQSIETLNLINAIHKQITKENNIPKKYEVEIELAGVIFRLNVKDLTKFMLEINKLNLAEERKK